LGNSGSVSIIDSADRIPEYDFIINDIEIERPVEVKTKPYSQLKRSKTNIPHHHDEQVVPLNEQEIDFLFLYYPKTIIRIPLYRQPSFLIFTISLPLFFLNLFTLSVFFLEGGDFSSKMQILGTILVALYALTFSVRQMLPQVPYITYLEYQILYSLLILFIECIGSLIMYETSKTDSDDSPIIVNYITGGLGLLILLAYVARFTWKFIAYKKRN